MVSFSPFQFTHKPIKMVSWQNFNNSAAKYFYIQQKSEITANIFIQYNFHSETYQNQIHLRRKYNTVHIKCMTYHQGNDFTDQLERKNIYTKINQSKLIILKMSANFSQCTTYVLQPKMDPANITPYFKQVF